MSRVRNYCWTLNNYSEADIESIKSWGDVIYTIFGKEKGEGGTEHLQGYTEFKNPIRITTLKKREPRIHWEERKGTQAQAIEYCKKEGNFVETGLCKTQGKRTDLENVAELAKDKTVPMKEVANSYPTTFIKYSKGITALRNLQYDHRKEAPEVHWRWGLAGTGKTRYCVEAHASHYIKDGTMWWDGYEQQEAIIIDDFDGKWPYRDFLRILDRYSYQGQVKGGYIAINSPFIYVTCEYPPNHFWAGNELEQVTRRLKTVTEVLKPVTEVNSTD